MDEATQSSIVWLFTAALFAPLISSMAIILLTRRVMFKGAGVFATAVMGGAFVCCVMALLRWLGVDDGQPTAIVRNVPWIPVPGTEAGWLYLGVMVDGLTVAMMTMVTGVSTLVHIYSIGYMDGDKRYNRFFAYLSLFSFSMLGIVLANSVLMLFVFWELVGLTSYLLIGFWFEKRGPQLACKKAFVMNRIGDMGFLIGFGILFYQLGGKLMLPATVGQDGNMFASLLDRLREQDPSFSITNPPMWLTAAGIGLFFGAIGKSAQFPLHTWLPDAMEGPTPVSSIVHSATMVAAGVYLTGRIYPILTPGAHLFIATIGLITLVMAACMAMVMTDIKRVLAYSTLSQLGYMILGLGVGSYTFALFHLFTHAFFKCCLFQCSGSVIHAAHHEQDMRQYGGLGKKMPVTMACYAVCTLAISGVGLGSCSLFSGFYSKDGIIAGAVNYGDALGGMGSLFYWGPIVIAYITPFYMARSFFLTFFGKPRNEHLFDHAHEAPKAMVIPQIVLAGMAILAVPWLMGFWYDLVESSRIAMENVGVTWVQPGDMHAMEHGSHVVHAMLLYGLAGALMIGVGGVMYLGGFKISEKIVALPVINVLYKWALNKFYFDALYDVFTVNAGKVLAQIASVFDQYVVDGLVNMTGWVTKVVSEMAGWVDLRCVDGAVNGAAAMATSGGQVLRTTQSGRVRGYVLLLFGFGAVATLLVITVTLVTG